MSRAIVWFRQDLRLADNPALHAACESCDEIIPLYIDDTEEGPSTALGSASRVWLHHSLESLTKALEDHYKAKLIIKQQSPEQCLKELIKTFDVSHIFWNRCYSPYSVERDSRLKEQLGKICEVKSFKANLINEPWQLLKQDGGPYRVFTPYWKTALAQGINDSPLPQPKSVKTPKSLGSTSVDDLDLLPDINWHERMMAHWQVGEQSAHDKLEMFLHDSAANYKNDRDKPGIYGTSQLSPHLQFGEISPRQIVHASLQARDDQPGSEKGINTFLSEVGWREFAYNLLYHFPQTISGPLNGKFNDFPWADANHTADQLKAWQQGQTGFPIIDAGMRQLWLTGWMHNRVRMIVASFLTKNLLIPWQQGEAWFRDTLVDADLASNVMGWQWVAGSGADAAPYFRIFNPVLQSEKFDPNGDYIRRWAPELKDVDKKKIHQPDGEIEGYPEPIVDLKATRQRALNAYNEIK